MATTTCWTWRPEGDYTCSECMSLPRYTWDEQQRPHEATCDCLHYPLNVWGRWEFRNPQWTDMGYAEQGSSIMKVIPAKEEARDVELTISENEEISVSISLSTSVTGEVPGGLEATIESQVTASLSHTHSVGVTESVAVPAGNQVVVRKITYEGSLIVFCDRIFVVDPSFVGLFNDGEVEGAIEQIGEGTYTFFGYDWDLR